MAVNKVVFGTDTLIDISDSTVAPDTLLKDIIAYAANGERIVGTAEAGGLPDGISALATGKFTLSSYSAWHTVTHNLGVVPNFVMGVANTTVITSNFKSRTVFVVTVNQDIGTSASVASPYRYYGYVNSSGKFTVGCTNIDSMSDRATTTTADIGTGNYTLPAGVEYIWVCGVIDGLS